MSRVNEALSRANAARQPAAGGPGAAPATERGFRAGLDQYPAEDAAAPGSAIVDEQVGQRAAVSVGHRSDPLVTPRFSEAYRGRLVIDPGVSAASIEQYRRLAATVHHLQAEYGLARLMVSSALPHEGKTLTVVNLALTLSESYARRVLLIDADLRRPALHQVFGISSRHGLGDVLRSERAPFQPARITKNLWVLPAGSPDANHMAALASRQIERFLDEMRPHFDWILLDAPPYGVMADAGLLVRLTRAVVFVIAAGSTPYALVEKAINEFGREHIVGTVLNRVEESMAHWSEYYSTNRREQPDPNSEAVWKQKVEQLQP